MSVELHMVPVSAGDSTLIIDHSAERQYTLLIDAGLADAEVLEYLHQVGVSSLDLVILSHPDLDHIKGFIQVLDSDSISVRELWCFDLAFIREFVATGVIPKPDDGTHPIVYLHERMMMSLVGSDEILTTAAIRNVPTFQVSEGHRRNLGNLHVEVMYPPDALYRAMHSARALKAFLAKRWPESWADCSEVEEDRPAHARKVTREHQKKWLDEKLREIQEDMGPLAGLFGDSRESDEACDPEEGLRENGPGSLPLPTVGRLYNNLSIVCKVHVLGGVRPITILFPGDLTDWSYMLARHVERLSSDILKHPHHGSIHVGIDHNAFWRYPLCCWPLLRITPPPFCDPRRRDCPWPDCHPRRYARCVRNFVLYYNGPEMLSRSVSPAHTLVFPYPARGLPDARSLSRKLGKLHANRAHLGVAALSDRSNPPQPRVLRIDPESAQISV